MKTTINTYLNFNGNCEEAFTFYKSVFGGDFTFMGRFDEMPAHDDYTVAEADKIKIMHVSLPIGDTVLMGSDISSEWSAKFAQGNNFSISINPDTKEDANRVFTQLSDGGQVVMPLADTFWGAYFGMFVDKFGINWMINFESNQ